MPFRFSFVLLLSSAVASLMHLNKFDIFKNKYLTAIQDTIVIDFVKSQISCATKCSEHTSCCMGSYWKSRQLCYVDITGSCNEPLFDVSGWVVFTKITNTSTNPTVRPRDCEEITNYNVDGVYTIYPTGSGTNGIQVYCMWSSEFVGVSGIWTVIQRRFDGSENFYRNWTDYKVGFGFPYGEYWLGNDNIHFLTNQDNYMLLVELEDWDGVEKYAIYDLFKIYNEASEYVLVVQGYSGTAGDALAVHNSIPFSTYDRDNDAYFDNCAEMGKGGFWYHHCQHANPNGLYIVNGPGTNNKGDVVAWEHFRGQDYSLKKCTMMVRRVP